jgi:hypothetical protein
LTLTPESRCPAPWSRSPRSPVRGRAPVTDGSGAFRLEPHGIAIESAPGESVDVDLVPPTGPDNGLELQADAYLETLELKRRLTVTGGAVWIRGDSSPVTLTARRP